MVDRLSYSKKVKSHAQRLGFDFCGIAAARRLDEEAYRLENWLKAGYQGAMKYMENHFDLRVDPTLLVPGARSVITLLKNYYPSARQQPEAPGISKYAFGKDYHEVIRSQLNELLTVLRDEIGEIQGRGFVDSAPVLERAWAVNSGLGWVGKNGNLINRSAGSFFFIATLITDLDMEPDASFQGDYCGTCTRCIDACPTGAILPGPVVNGSQCISYYTIELKDALLPATQEGKFGKWIFGCDICQDVCPWNRFSKPHQEPAFAPIPAILNLSTQDWQDLTEEEFKKLFQHSPLKRSKWKGLQRNVRFIQE
ncbi:MAG: tRNA epoxyqueuosine(34) reductase QueG [Chitinophagaceae bacterium]